MLQIDGLSRGRSWRPKRGLDKSSKATMSSKEQPTRELLLPATSFAGVPSTDAIASACEAVCNIAAAANNKADEY